MTEMIFMDNNSTTIMSPKVQREMIFWCNKGNPSSSYATAKEARAMMTAFREYIGQLCGIDSCCQETRDADLIEKQKLPGKRQDPSKYKIIFTSGASESNCTVLKSVVDAYMDAKGIVPHLVISAVEHRSLLDMAQSMEKRGRLTVTYVNPAPSGHILAADVNAAIRDNTCLVCVMHANNETGAIMDIKAIGAVAHKRNVPFHCDAVQTFGKFPLNPVVNNVDSFCISFHKFGGPPGVGVLVIKQQLIIGYDLQPLIFGSQNEHLRGGTENLPGIGAAFCALKCTMEQREAKNLSALAIKKYIMKEIAALIGSTVSGARNGASARNSTSAKSVRFYPDYLKATTSQPTAEIVFLSGIKNGGVQDQDYLHNTILLSVVKRPTAQNAAPMCNTEMKLQLEKKGIVVSVGSACNTASPKASHVLYAMGADEYIRKGALRISLGDLNTLDEAKKFVSEFLRVVSAQLEK